MRSLAALALLAAPAVAQQGSLAFDIAPTRDCVATGGGADCIGRAAASCRAQPGGQTTFGLSFCFSVEAEWWDARLNDVYRRLMAREREVDARVAGHYDTPPASRAEALRAMQRAWIPFRDAACAYERSQWGGGSGGRPATLACLMERTARQSLHLERHLEQQ
jgi:uncharacterized protein YecT (DUF1311 family)